MIRAIASVVSGMMTWFVVATVLNLGLRFGWADYAQVERAMAFTLPMMLVRLSIGGVASLCAGFVTSLVAKSSARPVYALCGMLLLLFIPIHYSLWDRFPVWYHLVFLGSLACVPIIGALTHRRFLTGSGSPAAAAKHANHSIRET